VRTIDLIDSSVTSTGQAFRALLDAPIVVDDRVIVPPRCGCVREAGECQVGRENIAGKIELALARQSVVFQGRTYYVTTSDVKQSRGKPRGKNWRRRSVRSTHWRTGGRRKRCRDWRCRRGGNYRAGFHQRQAGENSFRRLAWTSRKSSRLTLPIFRVENRSA